MVSHGFQVVRSGRVTTIHSMLVFLCFGMSPDSDGQKLVGAGFMGTGIGVLLAIKIDGPGRWNETNLNQSYRFLSKKTQTKQDTSAHRSIKRPRMFPHKCRVLSQGTIHQGPVLIRNLQCFGQRSRFMRLFSGYLVFYAALRPTKREPTF